jgi:flavodoxin
MNTIVIYGSRHGNTRKVAQAIANELRRHGTVHLFSVDDAPATIPAKTDLLVVGGPTEAHRMTQPMVTFFDQFGNSDLEGIAAAGFDTRLTWPRWLSGSAGAGITVRLRKAGANVIDPGASFVVAGKYPVLEAGELERATAWACSLAGKVESRAPAEAVR